MTNQINYCDIETVLTIEKNLEKMKEMCDKHTDAHNNPYSNAYNDEFYGVSIEAAEIEYVNDGLQKAADEHYSLNWFDEDFDG